MSSNIIVVDGKQFQLLIDQLSRDEIEAHVKLYMDDGCTEIFSRISHRKYDTFVLTTYALYGYRGE
jgi:hypothetical protein|tara:strand:+ start:211 stop:408 length:198 start_codon:yes stop_codon:yes gene_type:complete